MHAKFPKTARSDERRPQVFSPVRFNRRVFLSPWNPRRTPMLSPSRKASAPREKMKPQPRFRILATLLQGDFISDSAFVAICPATARRAKPVPNLTSFLRAGAKGFQTRIRKPAPPQPPQFHRHFPFPTLSSNIAAARVPQMKKAGGGKPSAARLTPCAIRRRKLYFTVMRLD